MGRMAAGSTIKVNSCERRDQKSRYGCSGYAAREAARGDALSCSRCIRLLGVLRGRSGSSPMSAMDGGELRRWKERDRGRCGLNSAGDIGSIRAMECLRSLCGLRGAGDGLRRGAGSIVRFGSCGGEGDRGSQSYQIGSTSCALRSHT